MSRTDKTDPYYVAMARSKGRKPDHHYACELNESPWYLYRRQLRGTQPCDLTDKPHHNTRCRWMDWDIHDRAIHGHYRKGHAQDRRTYWWGPSRQEERMVTSDLIKDYRANGDTDHVEFDHIYHHHGWDWWD